MQVGREVEQNDDVRLGTADAESHIHFGRACIYRGRRIYWWLVAGDAVWHILHPKLDHHLTLMTRRMVRRYPLQMYIANILLNVFWLPVHTSWVTIKV